jgi:hypothetical protein
MNMAVVIADSEQDYVSRLIDRLGELIPDMDLVACQSSKEVAEYVHNVHDRHLVFYNQADFQDLPRNLGTQNSADVDYCPFQPGISPDMDSSAMEADRTALWRLGSTRIISGRIKKWQSGLQCISSNTEVGSNATNRPEAAGLHLLFSTTAAGYRPDRSRTRLKELKNQVQTVIYLPLMPTYQMCCLVHPGQGPTLSDLLFRLLGKDIQPSQLGHYLQPNPDGYLQFRPPDRSDDLVTCCPESLRQLIVLVRDYVSCSSGQTAVLIDCAGMPFSLVSVVAVLCDICEVFLPERDCFSTQAARNEVGKLLAEMPVNCKVITRSDYS